MTIYWIRDRYSFDPEERPRLLLALLEHPMIEFVDTSTEGAFLDISPDLEPRVLARFELHYRSLVVTALSPEAADTAERRLLSLGLVHRVHRDWREEEESS